MLYHVIAYLLWECYTVGLKTFNLPSSTSYYVWLYITGYGPSILFGRSYLDLFAFSGSNTTISSNMALHYYVYWFQLLDGTYILWILVIENLSSLHNLKSENVSLGISSNTAIYGSNNISMILWNLWRFQRHWNNLKMEWGCIIVLQLNKESV